MKEICNNIGAQQITFNLKCKEKNPKTKKNVKSEKEHIKG